MTYLQKSRPAIEMALPKHLNPDRMMRLAVTCFSTTPALRNCSPQSILGSLLVACQLGLEVGVDGQAYLIPYGSTCTLVPGWKGIVSLVNNSQKAQVWTGAVFEGDEFEFQLGSNPKIHHIPGDDAGDPTKLTHAYACGRIMGSDVPVMEVWRAPRIWKHRDAFNKVGKGHYSFRHPEMYARKVVLLQIMKYMPKSIEITNALAAANAVEAGRTSKVQDGVVIEVDTDTPDRDTGAPETAPEQLEDSFVDVEADERGE